MKVLLLGGAGFIGKNLALNLTLNGHDVFVFDRANANYHELQENHDIKIIKGNFNDLDIFCDLFANNNIDVVIHLISSIIPGTALDSVISEVDQNLISTMKFLDAMKCWNVKKIIYFSSGGTVYGNNGNQENSENDVLMPINSYGWMKVTVEKYIQFYAYQNDLKYVILRPSNPYGRFQNIYGKQGLVAVTFGKIIKNEPVEVWGDGSVVRDYIYIEDLCSIVCEILNNERWNEIYNIGSGEGFSINQILKMINTVSGINFDITYKEGRSIDVKRNILNIDKIKHDFPVKDFTDLNKGISLTWKWVIEKHKTNQS